LDLLGRKIFMDGGRSVGLLSEEMQHEIELASKDAALADHAQALASAITKWTEVLGALGARAGTGDMEGALATSVWHLDLASTIVIGWQWLRMARAAPDPIREGKRAACAYWFTAEMTKVSELAARVLVEPAYLKVSPDAL
jgi:butyryl-CoA dehydrogenase